jgi:prolyl oligopeptidase
MALAADSPADPYLWLENITGDKALQWVHQQNARTTAAIETSPDFAPMRTSILNILNSKERIPYVAKHGKYYYNFWRDQQHVRGLWRRTSLEEFRKTDPAWETVLDVDQLAKDEKENWVWEGPDFLEPDFDRCLIRLSRGGADAVVVREFDVNSKQFPAGGFTLPEAKTDVAWENRDTLYVSTDFGPGSMTKSGYGRLVKEWRRGTPLSEAKLVFEGTVDDLGVGADVEHDHGHVYEFIGEDLTIFSDNMLLRRGDQWVHIDKPADAELGTFGDWLTLRLRSDWTVAGTTYPAGSLLAHKLHDYLAGDRHMTVLFAPTERRSLQGTGATKNYLILNEMDNVCGRPVLMRVENGQWTSTALAAPQFGTTEAEGVDPDESDDYFLTSEDFLTPASLYLGTAGKDGRELLKSLPAFFDATGLKTEQHEAISRDGTRVPYFQVGPANLKLDGNNPTLLYGYGGFEIPMQPGYNPAVGTAWLNRGNVYVLANIRGGGEFGPPWHNAARKEHRQRAYDDFIAIAEDLIARKVTSPKHLGIQGGSNGGLLMGVMLTERPDLFGAVVCQAPLLDMRRYNQLLAGASWMDEYGDPDKPEDWAFISKYSPYQNVHKDRTYPPVLFTTSTRDDRVHPGHARKMAALMEEQGHDVLFYENTEGGHAGAANNNERALMSALEYTFLLQRLQ